MAKIANNYQMNKLNYLVTIVFGICICTSGCNPQSADDTAEEKLLHLQKQAEAGDLESQLKLGRAYREGEEVEKDNNKAVKWFEKAASKNSPEAFNALGYAYAKGLGVEKNQKTACEYYQKSSDLAEPVGTVNLGLCYVDGKEWEKNEKKGVELISKSAEAGLPRAQYFMGMFTAIGMGGLKRDVKAAFKWLEKAALQNKDGKTKNEIRYIGNSQFEVGLAYEYGEGVEKSIVKANEFYLKAAEIGISEAQVNLGYAYYNGQGLPKDASKAFYWWEKAAVDGNVMAQAQLGYVYWVGNGVRVDRVLAYAWSNLAAAQDNKTGIRNRGIYEKELSSSDRDEAQRISSGWVKGKTLSRIDESIDAAQVEKKTTGTLRKISAGTAFLISKDGYAITNQHVVESCNEIRSEGIDGLLHVKKEDKVNDIALIKIPGPINNVAKIGAENRMVRQGDEIIVFGFPLNTVLSSGGNLTPGVVSALTGLDNNTNQIQITAPIQPGSSGSPVLNRKAEVVAVVSSKLSDTKMVRATGQVGQNVNFAISGLTLKSFLDTHSVNYSSGGFFNFSKSTSDIADEARKWTIVVECWR